MLAPPTVLACSGPFWFCLLLATAHTLGKLFACLPFPLLEDCPHPSHKEYRGYSTLPIVTRAVAIMWPFWVARNLPRRACRLINLAYSSVHDTCALLHALCQGSQLVSQHLSSIILIMVCDSSLAFVAILIHMQPPIACRFVVMMSHA